ncbi:MAG: divalent cation tolerance protein CutA [Candidatus Staskawiczbacteria bacterium]|nr:divalent cation tolerance protein CutA [Candidatus Staskawiczbacteria bacterium]
MIFIYVPCQNLDTAKNIAKLLVEKRMAGKVDIMPTNSVSWTAEGVAETQGATMIIMTIDKHVQDIEDIVREHYKGGIPCMATITLYRLNRDFKDWLIASTGL